MPRGILGPSQGRPSPPGASPRRSRAVAPNWGIFSQRLWGVSDQQLHGRQAAGDGACGCRLLEHAIGAAAAGVAGPDGDLHAQLRRHHVKPLRAILADAVHLPAQQGQPLSARSSTRSIRSRCGGRAPRLRRRRCVGRGVEAGAVSFAGGGGGCWPSVSAGCAVSAHSALYPKRARWKAWAVALRMKCTRQRCQVARSTMVAAAFSPSWASA